MRWNLKTNTNLKAKYILYVLIQRRDQCGETRPSSQAIDHKQERVRQVMSWKLLANLNKLLKKWDFFFKKDILSNKIIALLIYYVDLKLGPKKFII